jgi:RNA polymerase sigma-70 factor (ECF subfamily)
MELVALNEHIIGTVEEDEDWQVEDGVSIQEVKQSIDSLSERYKYPLMLYLIEGYDHEEISEILSITQVASRTLIHRGKRKLQDELKKNKNGTGY